jgi:branched-chain amino acid transport system substrate-binding protein
MRFKKLALGVAAAAMLASGLLAASTPSQAEDTVYVPLLTYRTGAFAGSGTPIADGLHDYLTMLNERDGGVGGARLIVEECETGYNAQKGVECYESTKGNGAVVYNPFSTGITLQLIPKAPVDEIPILSMGYGLSATAVGETFPWTFNAPATYWSQMSAIIKYIDSQDGGIAGKKIGYIYLDAGYGREPISLLDQLASDMGFETVQIPVAVEEMQNQSSHWLQVRRERPDWMIMWGWGAMNPTAIREAVNIGFDMDHFIGVWWSGGDTEVRPAGDGAVGYLSANFHATGTDFPAIQDVITHVVDKGLSQASRDSVGENYYNRGLMNSVLIAEAIRTAQQITGKVAITGADMRLGLENLDLTEERLAEIGLAGFTIPIKVTCKDHAGAHPIFLQRWNGTGWEPATDFITPMSDRVRPLLEAAAVEYISDKPDWQTQTCE